MSRYIDADVISSFGGVIAKEYDKESFIAGMEEVLKRVRNAPKIDIVRCKECKWAEPNREGDYNCRCHIPTFRVNENDFCSHGRKERQ